MNNPLAIRHFPVEVRDALKIKAVQEKISLQQLVIRVLTAYAKA